MYFYAETSEEVIKQKENFTSLMFLTLTYLFNPMSAAHFGAFD